MQKIICGKCGIEYSMPDEKYNSLIGDGGTFYCPNGHARHFTDSYKTKLERQMERTRQMEISRDYWMRQYDEAIAERDHIDRQRRGLCGYIAKLKLKLEQEKSCNTQ